MANALLTDGTKKRNFYELLKIGKPIIYWIYATQRVHLESTPVLASMNMRVPSLSLPPLRSTRLLRQCHAGCFCCQEKHPAEAKPWLWPQRCRSSHQATEEKPPNHGILNFNVVEERQGICYLFFFPLFPFGHSGSCFLTSSPCGKAKTMLFFTQGVYAGVGVLKQLRFPPNRSLQRASSKQNVKQGSARPPLPFPHPHCSKTPPFP